MPEGPEIRRAADRVRRALAGRRASRVFFGQEHLSAHGAELTGRQVREVAARGKGMVVSFSGDRHVYSHNQLYGRWYVRRAGDLPKTRRTLRFAVHNASASALLYSASEIEVLRGRELARHPYLAKLGPDPLDEATTAAQIAERAAGDTFRRRGFAALLLDQSFLAGIGNYLRSEILFFAGVSPKRRPADLGDEQLDRLGACALEITRRSYATRGITNRPDWVDELKGKGAPRRRYRHAVFAQQGRPCPRCGTSIEKRTAGGRRIYLCPSCQPES